MPNWSFRKCTPSCFSVHKLCFSCVPENHPTRHVYCPTGAHARARLHLFRRTFLDTVACETNAPTRRENCPTTSRRCVRLACAWCTFWLPSARAKNCPTRPRNYPTRGGHKLPNQRFALVFTLFPRARRAARNAPTRPRNSPTRGGGRRTIGVVWVYVFGRFLVRAKSPNSAHKLPNSASTAVLARGCSVYAFVRFSRAEELPNSARKWPN